MKAIPPNAGVEVISRKRKTCCDFRHRPVKRIVEAGKLRRRWKNLLSGPDQFQRLRNMQRSKVCRRLQFLEYLRRDAPVRPQSRSPVHHSVADDCWPAGVVAHHFSNGAECLSLRFVPAVSLHQRFPVGRTNPQRTVAAPDTVRTTGQQWFLVARASEVHAELQRRRTAVQYEKQIALSRPILHTYFAHFQLRISSLSMPSACAKLMLSIISPFSHSFT